MFERQEHFDPMSDNSEHGIITKGNREIRPTKWQIRQLQGGLFEKLVWQQQN
jgi:hypothetical protein